VLVGARDEAGCEAASPQRDCEPMTWLVPKLDPGHGGFPSINARERFIGSGDTPQHHLPRTLGASSESPPEGIDVVDEPPQDPTQPPQPTPPAAPQGPVTRLSKVAGIIILISGLGLTAFGGYGVVSSISSQPFLWEIVAFIASVVIVIGLPGLLGGIGILRGAGWGRGIGIFYSVSLGLVSLTVTIANMVGLDIEAGRVVEAEPKISLGLPFVLLFTYSAIVLMFRWRRPATASGATAGEGQQPPHRAPE